MSIQHGRHLVGMSAFSAKDGTAEFDDDRGLSHGLVVPSTLSGFDSYMRNEFAILKWFYRYCRFNQGVRARQGYRQPLIYRSGLPILTGQRPVACIYRRGCSATNQRRSSDGKWSDRASCCHISLDLLLCLSHPITAQPILQARANSCNAEARATGVSILFGSSAAPSVTPTPARPDRPT